MARLTKKTTPPVVIQEEFNSIGEFLRAIETRPKNQVTTKNGADASNSGTSSFTGSKSFKDAQNILSKGYKDGLDELGDFKKIIPTTNKRRITPAVVGFAPHIPNAILGVPTSMIAYNQSRIECKSIKIYYSFITPYWTTKEEMIRAGKLMLALVVALEQSNIRVRLVGVCACDGFKHHDVAKIDIMLKNFREPLNPLKLAYPLIHPSMLRRHFFRWMETNPDITDDFFKEKYGVYGGYGTVWKVSKLRNLKSIKDNEYCTSIDEACRCNNIQELARTMGMKFKI